MTASNAPDVDVQLNADDRRSVASLTSIDPQRSNSGQFYWVLRASLWVVLVLVSLVHPIVWVAVAIETAKFALELREGRRLRSRGALDMLNGRYRVSPEGLRKTSDFGETVVAWHAVEQLSQTTSHVVIRFSGTGFVLPLRCFKSEEDSQQFLAAMRLYIDRDRASG